ncbi:MAG TPA: hypothetical protein VGC54_04200 [Planctomycetota bacterium]
MNRDAAHEPVFPAGEPVGDVPPAEARALESLAQELRAACADPRGDQVLVARLVAGLRDARPAAGGWSPRGALRRDPLLRVAAILLLACVTAVPVTALVRLLQTPERERPTLVFDQLPAAPPSAALRERPRIEPERGEVPDPEVAGLPALRAALVRDNRMAHLSVQWRLAFPLPARAFGGLPADLDLETGARIGLELRLGLRAAAREALAEDWSAAPATLLWAEFERRLARDDRTPPPADLILRVDSIWDSAASGQDRQWLSGWKALLDGPGASDSYRIPEPGGEAARVFWRAVTWWPSLIDGGSAAPRR